MKYPCTIKRAKELTKIALGHNLKPGYCREVAVIKTPLGERVDYSLWLKNEFGKFSLYSWTRPFTSPDMSKITWKASP